ncbi:MAG: N-acetylmuramoyl-L-alanine amidase [Gammaproteobacteria bacterium]|nr:N-acetylmuramoyl-L-alanine amidase [Gammaproteobacteria bacterium]
MPMDKAGVRLIFWSTTWLVLLLVWMAPLLSEARTSGKSRTAVKRVIIHSIGGPSCNNNAVIYSAADGDAKRWIGFFNRHRVLGIHYVIDRFGQIEAGVPENQIANHAKGNNSDSIGIELVNRGDGIDPYPDLQLGMLVAALRSITRRWGIAKISIVGHSSVDRRSFECGGRKIKTKQDPGPAFPWERVLRAIK